MKINKWLKIGTMVVFMFQLTLIAHASGVKMSWQANTESDLAGYKVYYGTASGTYQNVVDVGNFATAEVDGLTKDATYYFALTAYNTSGNESGYSEEVQATISPEAAQGGSLLPGGSSPGTTPSGGGGGGGGCFILTSTMDYPFMQASFFALIGMLAGIAQLVRKSVRK
jgi:hypothetical protein